MTTKCQPRKFKARFVVRIVQGRLADEVTEAVSDALLQAEGGTYDQALRTFGRKVVRAFLRALRTTAKRLKDGSLYRRVGK